MRKTIDILRSARSLVEVGWTQEAYARNDAGTQVFLVSDAAVCYCALGALLAAGDKAGIEISKMHGRGGIAGRDDDPSWAAALDLVVRSAKIDYASRRLYPAGRRKGAEALVCCNDHHRAREADVVGWFDMALAEAVKAGTGTNQ